MYEQATIAVQDEKHYAELHRLIDAALDPRDVDVFLDRLTRARLRVRDFESILKRGLLGKEAVGLFAVLSASDQGLTRERYLSLVEAVSQDIRERYFKTYAYY